jgi:hypothetical protein
MDLTDAVENATRLARHKGEDHVVGRDKHNQRYWLIAHGEDLAGQEDMIDPIMVVHPDGLDKKYEKEGLVEFRLDFAV